MELLNDAADDMDDIIAEVTAHHQGSKSLVARRDQDPGKCLTYAGGSPNCDADIEDDAGNQLRTISTTPRTSSTKKLE